MKYSQGISWYKNDYIKKDFIKKESLHYLFYFKKDSLAQEDIKNIISKKEKHYKKILDWLNLNNDRKIEYYLYPSLKEKLVLMGDNSLGNAIWKKLEIDNEKTVSQKFEIHILYNEKCKFINEHEDTHLLSLPWGLSLYLFCEGLAQYMENTFAEEDLHEASKKLLKKNKLYSIEFLFDNKNWDKVESMIIYPQTGSFSKFIIGKYGKDKFEKLYKNTSRNNNIDKNLKEFKKVYNKKLNQTEKEWLEFLKENKF